MLNNIVKRFNISNLFSSEQIENPSYSQNEPTPGIVRITQMKNVQYEGLRLFERKNRDYGDAFARYGPIGVLMRMGDKISRLQSITKTGVVLVNDEQVRDTLIDLHNYSAMAIMLLDEGKELIIEDSTYGDDVEEPKKCRYKRPVLAGVILSSVGIVTYRYLVNRRG
jgi:hypothetical protein